MDALQYLESLGPNPLTPVIKRLGFIMPGVAYEVSMDWDGMDGKPLWAVTVAHEVPADDGGTTCKIWHERSQAMKSEKACNTYILDLIQELDPFDKDGAGPT